MLNLHHILNALEITRTQLADAISVSRPTISTLCNHGHWPARQPEQLKAKIEEFLTESGATAATVATAFDEEGKTPTPTKSEEDKPMLMHKPTLTQETRKMFGLFRNPFDEVQSADEVWISPDVRYVREAMFQTARHGGFIAVVGESGAGKSTLRRDLAHRIQDEKHPVMLIEPYTIEAEDNDIKGKRFKSSDITAALLAAVAPSEKPKINPQARFAQLHKALEDSHVAGFRHCVLIEEAHSLPIPTLKHLKRLLELEVGFTRLVSVILIGQPELLDKLSVHRMDVREVVQRCELVTLNPITPETLQDFLEFRFKKAGCKTLEFLDDSAIGALVERLQLPNRKRDARISNLYPLAVGNLMVSAMNLAAEIGVPEINADVIKAV